MFFGTYSHQLDDKGRLRLPAKIRTELNGKFFVMKGMDDTLFVFSCDRFNEFAVMFSKLSYTNAKAQASISDMISSAFEVEEDSQGRFVLPSSLKTFAKIEKNVIIKGVIDRLEIVSEETNNARPVRSFNEILSELEQEMAK